MPVQLTTDPVTSSGPISFSDLRSKLKETSTGSVSMSELYRNGPFVVSGPTNNNIPTAGIITASNFYGSNIRAIATITGVEENLIAGTNALFGSSIYASAVKKTIVVNGAIISQNTSFAGLNLPIGAGSTITVQLTSGGIFGHRAVTGGSGGSANGGTGGNGGDGGLAMTIGTGLNVRIVGTGGIIAGGGGSGGGGGGGGQEGGGGKNKRGFSCNFLGWQYCESCDDGVGGGSDSGGTGGAGGVGQGYSWNGTTLTLITAGTGAAGANPNNGGGAGGAGGNGGGWGSTAAGGANGNNGSQGPGGNCQAGGGGSGGGSSGSGGTGGRSIVGYNKVVYIESTSVLFGATLNN